MASEREVSEPLESEKDRIAALELLLQVYLAEYNNVREEVRDRAEASRRILDYGGAALAVLAPILVGLQARSIPGFEQLPQGFPSHYLFLVLPILWLYLVATYLNSAGGEYAARAYATCVLGPKVRQIIALCTNAGTGHLREEIWKWDIFDRQMLAGAKYRVVTGLTIHPIAVGLFVALPTAVFLVPSITQEGYWCRWEPVLVVIIWAIAVANLWKMHYVLRETCECTTQYCVTGEITPLRFPFSFERREARGEDHIESGQRGEQQH